MIGRRHAPGFLRHLLLLWELRLSVRRGGALALGTTLLMTGIPAVSLGVAAFLALSHPEVARSPEWSSFFLGLLGFVTTGVWCTWPVLSAGVDDHAELSRYAAFPLAPLRLLLASSLAEMVTPIAVLVHAPFAGALAGHAWAHGIALPFVLVVLSAYLLFNAAWGRVGLHLVLDVLRRERSGGAIGLFLLALVGLGTLLPPVDTSWLTAVLDGLGVVGSELVARAALALSRVPTGHPGEALRHVAEGRTALFALEVAGLLYFAAIGFWLALRLLVKFHRSAGHAMVGTRLRRVDPFARASTRVGVLVVREAIDLWNNPWARLLASVPVLLTILLGLLSGRDLFLHLLGAGADGWLMTALSLYSTVLLASTFGQNAFGYDGHGLASLWMSPADVGEVMAAKNVVTGGAAFALAAAVVVFYRLYFGAGAQADVLFALLSSLVLLPVLLASGNLISIAYPARFDATLRRRNRQPATASFAGLAAAFLGASPALLVLRLPSWEAGQRLAVLACIGVVTWVLFFASLRRTMPLLLSRREAILLAVTRE